MSVKPLTSPLSATTVLGEVVLPGRLLKFCSVDACASYLQAQGSSWHSRCSRAFHLSGRNQQSSSKSEIPKSAVLTDLLPLVNSPFSNSSSVILPFLNFFKSLVSLRSSSMSSSSISEPWVQKRSTSYWISQQQCSKWNQPFLISNYKLLDQLPQTQRIPHPGHQGSLEIWESNAIPVRR